jgi:hypothetical protein
MQKPPSQPGDRENKETGSVKNGSAGGGDDGRRQLIRYAGLSTQVAASVGVSLWLGIKADKWLKLSFPIFSCVLPLLVIVFLLVQLIKAGSGGKDEK